MTTRIKVNSLGLAALFVLSLGMSQYLLGQQSPAHQKRVELLNRLEPSSANPYTSILPAGVKPDYSYWNAYLRYEAEKRARFLKIRGNGNNSIVTFAEVEPNDKQFDANFLANFGNTADPVATISGNLELLSDPIPTTISTAEENGSISTASSTGINQINEAVIIQSEIGDGIHGSGQGNSGDYDHFTVSGLAGNLLIVDVDTPEPRGALDPIVAIFDDAGNSLALNDDDGSTFDSYLAFRIPATANYTVAIGGYFFGQFQADASDPSSGPGANSEGIYTMTISMIEPNGDWFSFDLNAGDIIGASLSGAAKLTLVAPDGIEKHGSTQDASGLYGNGRGGNSPLPGGGDAVVAFVADQAGTFALQVSEGAGDYDIDLRVFRADDRPSEDAIQILFVDFDGQTIDAAKLFGTGNSSAELSPLVDFLPNWGLSSSDENAVIDAILANLEETLVTDMQSHGNKNFEIIIQNSRDDLDPSCNGNDDLNQTDECEAVLQGPDDCDDLGFDDDCEQIKFTRLVIGGTTSELGISTIGIASAIDIGNFDTENTGVTLLDLLSAASNNPNSLNKFTLAPGANMIDLVGEGLGNVTAHEAGHVLGNYHTSQFNGTPSLMDQGGNLSNTLGIGPDDIFGSPDDIDVDLIVDEFVSGEGFTGFENQAAHVAWTAGPTAPLPVEMISWTAEADQNTAILKWTTASENNNAGFIIQQLLHEGFYRELAFIEGQGNSQLENSYEYRVSELAPGFHTFRLKQVDYDGRFEISRSIEVGIDQAEELWLSSVYPNPFNPRAQFTMSLAKTQEVKIELYDLIGQRVNTIHSGELSAGKTHSFVIDGQSLSTGTYFVKVQGQDFQSKSVAIQVAK